MRFWGLAPLLVLAIIPAHAHSGAAAQASTEDSIFKLEQLSDRAWALFGRGGTVAFLVTETGVLVVDSQYENIAEGIIEQIRTVTDRPIRYLVNTHFHGDHAGGNPIFNKVADIIAHHTVRPRLLQYPLELKQTLPGEIRGFEAEIKRLNDDEDPYKVTLSRELRLARSFLERAESFDAGAIAAPALTYEKNIRVWFGDQEIDIFHVGPGHTDGDSIVFFRNENVLHMGDIFFHGMYPFIDTRGGGSFSGVIANVEQALASVRPDTRVIPGHGPITDVPTLRRYRQFLVDLQGKVSGAVEGGQSLAEAIRSIQMDDYPEIKPLFRTLGNNITAAYAEMKGNR